MCIRDSLRATREGRHAEETETQEHGAGKRHHEGDLPEDRAVSYTHLRAHETVLDLVCRLLLDKKQTHNTHTHTHNVTLIIISDDPQNTDPHHQ